MSELSSPTPEPIRRLTPPRDFWALNVPGAFPLTPFAPGSTPLTAEDFPSGSFEADAVPWVASYIQRGFSLEPAAHLDLPGRLLWSRVVADSLSAIVSGLRATHRRFPDNDRPPYHNILPSEAAPLLRCREAAVLTNAFFSHDENGLDTYNHDDVCLGCLMLADPGTDEERLTMAAKSCGGDIETARTSLFNERIREINLELDDWKQQTVEASQMAICDAVCEREFDPDLFPEGADRLRTWIEGWLTDRSISSAIRMWYADKVQEAKDSLAPQYDAEFQVFAEDCKSSHTARMANMQTESERELLAFKSTIRLETDELKANVLRASNKASLTGKLLLEIKASLDAEAQADLDSYISKLKADTEAAKDVARKKASSGLNQAQRVASGSSHKTAKTARARATPSARPTPRLPSTSLPGEVVPSSQTPPEMSPAPSDRSLPPITTTLPPAPASPSPHKRARSESTTPTPRDPIPAAPLPQRVLSRLPHQQPLLLRVRQLVEAPVDGLVAALAAFSEQLHTINSRLERIETREADQRQFDEVYDAWQRDADMAEADDVPEEYRYGADGQHPPLSFMAIPRTAPPTQKPANSIAGFSMLTTHLVPSG
ncbi:hypothetical protein BC826DRAFT_972824 [Russula brevipes]|nr:hypothetical protein BC826DRAFT_972824 [Russula brevipes]